MIMSIGYTATVLAAALAGAGPLPDAPAYATVLPAYTCDDLGGDPTTTRVHGNCTASSGAVTHGPYRGESILASRTFPVRVRCTGGGVANVPADVSGNNCSRIR
jgi:hypothetical protein